MATEAQIRANQANSARSSGPSDTSKTRFNAVKHGLTAKLAISDADTHALKKHIDDFTAEMNPRTARGRRKIVIMARSCVIMDRAAEHESAAVANNVRNAIDKYDEERLNLAATQFENLHEDPRNNLRRLRKSPEGVDLLIDGWCDLRSDLLADPKPTWTAAHLEQAAHMMGYHTRHARTSRVGTLSRGFWGDFGGLHECDGGQLPDAARQKWARSALIALIDGEIAALEAHRETLDFETIEQDRQEAPSRALFDSSKEACKARRYEQDAVRTYFKSLNEFRKVEAEYQSPNRPPTPHPRRRRDRPRMR
jgi:hypothetical protein